MISSTIKLSALATLAISLQSMANPLVKRANCANTPYGPTQEVVNCANYLTSKGSEPCCVGAGGSVGFCNDGVVEVVGVNTDDTGEQCATRQDVARAVGFILNDCTQNYGTGLGDQTGGQAFAYGNGYINVLAGKYNND